ncbi:MAG: NADH-quinone oxidoreductase subunit M [Puniceicoccales bacterium]|nr:NADH-quinone oxidoreductase subunit M [Puniceicoccales bacterium]
MFSNTLTAAAAAPLAAVAQTGTSTLPALIVAAPAVVALLFALDAVFNGKLATAEASGGAAGGRAIRLLGLLASLAPLVFGLAALMRPDGLTLTTGDGTGGGFLGISYELALSGKSLLLVVLTGIVAPLALVASRRLARPLLFNTLFLFMESAALGVFLAQNFFFWFLFWELSLVPAYFLIKLWGGPGASRAAFQFVLYTIGGSAFMLAAFGAVYAAAGTWDFRSLATCGLSGALAAKFGAAAPTLIFAGVLLGLAAKVPLFPLHTWLPDAYAEAPTGVSMFLTAVMSKMGVFGFLAILHPLFPNELAAAARWLLWLAVAGVVLGAWAALRQRDLKRMVAYSSVNHLSYCLLALFATQFAGTGEADLLSVDAALSGAWLQMFNHGLSAAALFFCLGALEDRTGARGIGDFGGVRTAAPMFATLCGVAMFSSLGLPGLNGFAGEFLIFRGVFGLAPAAAAISTLGLLATAVFLLTFWQKVFHGGIAGRTPAVKDLTSVETLALTPVAFLMLLFGVWPQLLLNFLR